MAEANVVKIELLDSEPIKQIIDAAGNLAQKVEWGLEDLTYTAPEDTERQRRAFGVMREAIADWKMAIEEVKSP